MKNQTKVFIISALAAVVLSQNLNFDPLSISTKLGNLQRDNLPNLSDSIKNKYANWQTYGGTADAARYSSLDQINTTNVQNLKTAWTFHTEEKDAGQIQCQPIIVNGVAYLTSAKINVFALDAATGAKLWQFDPFKTWGGQNSWAGTNRGVTFWQSPDGSDQRIFFSAGSSLIALNAKNGQPILDFGEGGKIDLQQGLDTDKKHFLLTSNTPPTAYKELIISGFRTAEDRSAAPGHIRAFDARTGKRRWIFHTIPQGNEFGVATWKTPKSNENTGGANNWSGMSLDEKRGIVYVPTGSAVFDFWGGSRLGDNLFSDCLLALNAETGERIWHFQFVHHDIWDRDLPANPNLVSIKRNGKMVDAVAQITKQGYVFVFDRLTGKPIFPIKEVKVPPSVLDGEMASKTQPLPTLPKPYMRTKMTENDIIDISPEHKAEMLKRFRQHESGNMWLPPSEKGVILLPGFDGGGEWGGASFDPTTGWLYVNSNEMPWVLKMNPNNKAEPLGLRTYKLYCANCHGANLKGNLPTFPSMVGLEKKYNPKNLDSLLKVGRGAMPPFQHISQSDRDAMINFLLKIEDKTAKKELESTDENAQQTPYTLAGYTRFVTKDGYPGIKPPWGTLNAINLNTGKTMWQVPLGELKELTAKGIPPTGTENYGGPVTTAGGLIFIGATKDEQFRIFDKKTGKIVWQTQLPAAAHATPATYMVNGKQYILIACGGGKLGTKVGDSYVAFCLN